MSGWYRFKFRHGPGHQGNTEVYEWYGYEPSDAEQKDAMHEIAHDHYIEDWFCDCEKVEKLPEKVRAEKLDLFQRQKSHAETMLKALESA